MEQTVTSVCKLYAHVSSSWLIHTSLSELAAFSKLDLDPADGLCFDVSQHTPRVVCTGMGAQAWEHRHGTQKTKAMMSIEQLSCQT